MSLHRCWPGEPCLEGQLLVQREMPLPSGRFLWRHGDAFQSLALVRSGCVKVYEEAANGDKRVLQFALAGDLLGFEALASQRHESHAIACGDVLVCRLAVPLDSGTLANDAGLYRPLLLRASSILQERLKLSRTADPAVSLQQFLERLAGRMGREILRNGQSYWHIQLPMSRLEIGDYLGYAEETVCRSLRRLQLQGRLEVRGRELLLPAAPRTGLSTEA